MSTTRGAERITSMRNKGQQHLDLGLRGAQAIPVPGARGRPAGAKSSKGGAKNKVSKIVEAQHKADASKVFFQKKAKTKLLGSVTKPVEQPTVKAVTTAGAVEPIVEVQADPDVEQPYKGTFKGAIHAGDTKNQIIWGPDGDLHHDGVKMVKADGSVLLTHHPNELQKYLEDPHDLGLRLVAILSAHSGQIKVAKTAGTKRKRASAQEEKAYELTFGVTSAPMFRKSDPEDEGGEGASTLAVRWYSWIYNVSLCFGPRGHRPLTPPPYPPPPAVHRCRDTHTARGRPGAVAVLRGEGARGCCHGDGRQ